MANETPFDSHWILVRGLARETRHWGQFPTDILQSFNSVPGLRTKVDAIDLPGAGRYSEMRSPISVPEITEFVRGKFLEIRNRQREKGEPPAKKNFLFAVSLGGMVASSWLERWPDDFSGCVLVNTSFRGFSPIHHRLSPQGLRHLFEAARSRDAFKQELNVLKLISNRPEIYEKTAEEWAKYSLERPVSYENFARQLIAAARFEPKLRTPPIPILILSSQKDRMVSPECSEAIARRWSAEIHRHPTAGHDLTTDDSAWVVEKMLLWWRKRFPENSPLTAQSL